MNRAKAETHTYSDFLLPLGTGPPPGSSLSGASGMQVTGPHRSTAARKGCGAGCPAERGALRTGAAVTGGRRPETCRNARALGKGPRGSKRHCLRSCRSPRCDRITGSTLPERWLVVKASSFRMASAPGGVESPSVAEESLQPHASSWRAAGSAPSAGGEAEPVLCPSPPSPASGRSPAGPAEGACPKEDTRTLQLTLSCHFVFPAAAFKRTARPHEKQQPCSVLRSGQQVLRVSQWEAASSYTQDARHSRQAERTLGHPLRRRLSRRGSAQAALWPPVLSWERTGELQTFPMSRLNIS